VFISFGGVLLRNFPNRATNRTALCGNVMPFFAFSAQRVLSLNNADEWLLVTMNNLHHHWELKVVIAIQYWVTYFILTFFSWFWNIKDVRHHTSEVKTYTHIRWCLSFLVSRSHRWISVVRFQATTWIRREQGKALARNRPRRLWWSAWFLYNSEEIV